MLPFIVISRWGTRIIAAAAGLGLFLPELAAALRPYLGDFVVTMLIVSLLRVDFSAFLTRLRRPLPAFAAAGWITVVLPLVLLGAAAAIGGSVGGPLVLAVLFLFSAPPPIVSAPAFAMLMGFDGAMVLAVMLIATILMPLTAPYIAALFVADILPISALDLALRLALLIAIGFAIAIGLRAVLGKRRIEVAKPVLDTVSVLIAVLFAIGAMDGVAAFILDRPGYVAAAAAGAFGFSIAQMMLTFALFRPFVGIDAMAIAYAAASRNGGLVVAAIGVNKIDDTVWLWFALSQLPIFFLPLALQPIGRRITRRAAPQETAL